MSEIKKPKPRSPLSHVQSKPVPIRERVLKAAFSLFREHGFSSTSMLEIVTRARVSKRDLYALFDNLQQLQDTMRFLSQASIELQSLFQASNSHGHGGILQVPGQLG
jgi:AcrR family transcriptional regulator